MSADVMDGARIGHCPRCGAELQQPEINYRANGDPFVESGDYWCGACGWSEDEDDGEVVR